MADKNFFFWAGECRAGLWFQGLSLKNTPRLQLFVLLTWRMPPGMAPCFVAVLAYLVRVCELQRNSSGGQLQVCCSRHSVAEQRCPSCFPPDVP